MKTTKIFSLLILILCSFSFFQSRAQSVVLKNSDITITLKKNGELVAEFTSGSGLDVLSPNGNFLKTMVFQVPEDNEIMDFSGPVKTFGAAIWIDFNDNGEKENGEILIDSFAVLTKSGRLSFSFHKNGAGTYLPWGL